MDGDDTDLPVIPARGRARSHSMHEATHADLAGEIDALNGGPTPAPAAGAGAASVPAKPGQLSKKTITMLTDLAAASGVPPEMESSQEHVLSEAELAERELIVEEQKKRALEQREAAVAVPPQATAGAASRPSGPGARKQKGDDKDYDVLIKLLLLGDGGVGKTSLMLRFSEDKFSSSLLATAGVDYKTQFLVVDGKRVKCQIWDTAGQQRFHVITQAYYRGAHGIVLVYDASDPAEESFHNVRYWSENITKHANPACSKLLVGNKIDVKGPRIETSRGAGVAAEHGMRFCETSAKDGTGVTAAFQDIARDVVSKILAAGGDAFVGGGSGGGGGAASASAPRASDKKDAAGGGKGKDCTVQ